VNILVVGAGAVGQVYGYHLQRGGARVSFLVRAGSPLPGEAGYTLYPIKHRYERVPVAFHPERVFDSLADVARERWDQVWLCVPATAIEDGWLRSIAAAVGSALIVALPPGVDSENKIRQAFPGNDVVSGLIGMISYQAPLPGEDVPRPGIAYLLPPLGPSTFSGRGAGSVADLLLRGDCPVAVKPGPNLDSAFGSCLLMPSVAALELAGWSIRNLRRSELLPLGASASRQAMDIVSARLDTPPPAFQALLRGPLLSLVWGLFPHLVPIDLEAYLHHHFTKVGGQTRLLLAGYIRDGEALALDTSALQELASRLRESDTARAA
jgi:2-dehydropantoate 2-reductase